MGTGGTGYLFTNTFQSNLAGQNGGGAYLEGNGEVQGTVFRRNQANASGGGAYLQGPATVQGSLFEQNQVLTDGGGLLASDGLTLNATRFLSNSAQSGGGVQLWKVGTVSNTIRLVNLLFAGNSASAEGAALRATLYNGNLTVLHTTIVSPTVHPGSAIQVEAAVGGALISNTLIASHTVGFANLLVLGLRENHNLFSQVTTPYSGATIVQGGQSITGPAGLADHLTYQLGPSSAAINAGANWGVSTDYFGNPRPIGSAPDIGYHEANFTLYPLTITMSGNGNGVVTPTVGTHQYVSGTMVMVSATANFGSSFTAWSGDFCFGGSGGTCSITMSGPRNLNANFSTNKYHMPFIWR